METGKISTFSVFSLGKAAGERDLNVWMSKTTWSKLENLEDELNRRRYYSYD